MTEAAKPAEGIKSDRDVIADVFSIMVDRAVNRAHNRNTPEPNDSYIARRVKEGLLGIFPEYSADVEKIFEPLSISMGDLSALAAELKRVGTDFLARFPLEELNERSYRAAARGSDGKDYIPVNRMLLYDVKGEVLSLHIPARFTRKTHRDQIALAKEFRDALKLLAARLRADPELRGIQTIRGFSWLLKSRPYIAKMIGFPERDEAGLAASGSMTIEATMSKDRFLEVHGA